MQPIDWYDLVILLGIRVLGFIILLGHLVDGLRTDLFMLTPPCNTCPVYPFPTKSMCW